MAFIDVLHFLMQARFQQLKGIIFHILTPELIYSKKRVIMHSCLNIGLEDYMKATGIVRRIDELGRIVIPKEIRRTLRIRETDPMEIFTDKEGEIVLKKYSPLGELAECAKEYSESLARTTGNVVCISDREQIIAMSGTVKKELVEKPVSDKLEQIMHDRENFMSDDNKRNYINISDEIENEYNSQIISPIICHGDVLGAVIMLSKDGKKQFGEQEKQMVMVASDFLGHHMES